MQVHEWACTNREPIETGTLRLTLWITLATLAISRVAVRVSQSQRKHHYPLRNYIAQFTKKNE